MDPPQTPPPPNFSQKPKFNIFLFLKPSLIQDNAERDLKQELQTLISEDINNENIQQITTTQAKLKDLETKKLFDILSTKKNFLLLDDERPTKTFLNIESSKKGYSEFRDNTFKNKKSQL